MEQRNYVSFKNRFIIDKNFRILILWLIIGIMLVFNLFVFGIGPPERYYMSESTREFYKLAGIKVPDWGDYLLDSLHRPAWCIWFILLICGIIYTPFVLTANISDILKKIGDRNLIKDDKDKIVKHEPSFRKMFLSDILAEAAWDFLSRIFKKKK
jgi:hypothetical protein